MIASAARLPTCWSVCLGVQEVKPRKHRHLAERKTLANWFSRPSAAASCQAALRPLGSLEERSPYAQRLFLQKIFRFYWTNCRCLESELVAAGCLLGSLRDLRRVDLGSGEERSGGSRETRYGSEKFWFVSLFNYFPADETRCY